MAHSSWHQESAPVRGDPDWMFDLAAVGNATIFYTTLGFYDPSMYAEPWAWKKKGFTWAGAVGMTGARLLGMFVLGSMIVDPMDKHPWGLAEMEWYQESVEKYVYPIPGDVWDWLGIESGQGIYG